jgi:hypothetical protein
MFSGEKGGEEFGDVGRQFRGLEYSYSLTHFVTHPFTNFVTYRFTHFFTHPFTHFVTHPFTHSLIQQQTFQSSTTLLFTELLLFT